MRRLRLIARGRALRPSQLLAGGLSVAILGVALAALAVPRWLSLLGVALATAGLATLAAAGYRRPGGDAGRRLLLAALLFALAAPAAAFLWFQHSAVDVALERITPQPGAPLTLSGVSDKQSPGHDPEQISPFFEGTLGSIEIADIGSRTLDAERPRSTFHIQLPVRVSDCNRLEAEFGKGCAGSATPLRDFEGFEISTLRRAMPITAVILPRGAPAVELIETTAQAQQRVPTEWSLAHGGPGTDVELHCLDGVPLQVSLPFSAVAVPVRCALDGAIFSFSVETSRSAPLFLSELSQLKADVDGSAAEVFVEKAELSIDGDAENLPHAPVKIALSAKEGEDIGLEIDQSLLSELNDVTLRSAGISSVTVGDRERIPNWFEQHPELMYFVIGILFATLVPALFDFILARLKR